jgi:hypothetical protein
MKRFCTTVLLAMMVAMVGAPAASATGDDDTVLNYSVKDARAFLWQIHYPQATFITEKYDPCVKAEDGYGCDRGRYAKPDPKTCDQPFGLTGEAAETPTEQEVAEAAGPSDQGGAAADWPVGNPVEVIHGLAMGRLGASPESGGLASMYYVDQSGRRETEAHVESDGYTSNRNAYEERCAKVDAFSEGSYYEGPFSAHVLSRADQKPSVYSMTAFTTAEGSTFPPNEPKESVSIVKLWQAGDKVHGVLTSTVRGIQLADQITVDLVRSVIAFSSDGTKEGLDVHAQTEALGLTVMGTKLPALEADNVIPLGDGSYLGVVSPVIQESTDGHQINVRAPGLFLAAKTPLDQLPIPEDPFTQEPFSLLPGAGDFKGQLTLGGKFFGEQVVYVAGAILDAGISRIPAFHLGPLPPLPNLPPLPPVKLPPVPVPSFTDVVVPGITQPVGVPHYVTRELAGSAWTLAAIVALTLLGLIGVMGRWAQQFPWAQSISNAPPFSGLGWAYRAFLKG